jgi:hypothetical protein
MSINAISLSAAIAATVVMAVTTSAPASAFSSGYRSPFTPMVRPAPPAPQLRVVTQPTVAFPETGYRLQQNPTWGAPTPPRGRHGR